MKICGTVYAARWPARSSALRSSGRRSTSISVKATPLRVSSALAAMAIGAIAAWCRFRLEALPCDLRSLLEALYMGRARRRHNPRENQHVDLGGAGAQQRPGAGVDGGAGGQHVVDQDQPAAGDRGLAVGRHAEGALHVGGALGLRQADLLRRRLARACSAS